MKRARSASPIIGPSRQAVRVAAVGAILGLATACGSDTAGRADQRADLSANARFVTGASGSAKIAYQSNVRLVERADAVRSLVGVSTDGSTLLFDPGNAAIKALKAGDVLVLKGIFARKVLATGADDSVIAVLTGPASLGEVVRDGRIRFDAPLRFSSLVAQASPAALRSLLDSLMEAAVPTAHADPVKEAADLAEKAKAKVDKALDFIKDDWNVNWSVTPGPGKLDLAITLTRDLGGVRALIEGKGHLADFDLSSDIEVESGTVEKLETAFKRLNGVMNFTWEVGKETPGAFDQELRVKLPGAISIPLYEVLDGLPLYLEVSGAIIVQPFITGGGQFSHGAFRITYDGTQNFRIQEGNIDSDGKVTGDIEFLKDRHISAAAPLGIAVTMAMPRIEVTLDPLRVLSDLQGDSSLQKAMEKAAERADLWMNNLARSLQGTQLGADIERARKAVGDVSAGKLVESMKSNAMAYMQLVTTNATSHTGLSVIAPCTRTELKIMAVVGASAQAFGQKTEPVSQTIFEKKFTRIDPPSVKLCQLERAG